jgi:hypothetical protein
VRHAIGIPVVLLGCDADSPAYKFGCRQNDVGRVVMTCGHLQCCAMPEYCSTVEFSTDSGMLVRLCVQDVHLRLLS